MNRSPGRVPRLVRPQPAISATEAADHPRPARARRWPLLVIGASAGTATWSGWVGLGSLTGFGMVHPLPGILDDLTVNTAITLPVGVEAYAVYALSVATDNRPLTRQARRYAWASAAAALLLGMAGQIAYHLIDAAGTTRAPWPVVALVSCLPVVVLGAASLLWHLAGKTADGDDPRPRFGAATPPEGPASVDGHAQSAIDGEPGTLALAPGEAAAGLDGTAAALGETAPALDVAAPAPVALAPEPALAIAPPSASAPGGAAAVVVGADATRTGAAESDAEPDTDRRPGTALDDEAIVAAVIATAPLPSARQIKATYRIGQAKAARVRAAALHHLTNTAPEINTQNELPAPEPQEQTTENTEIQPEKTTEKERSAHYLKIITNSPQQENHLEVNSYDTHATASP